MGKYKGYYYQGHIFPGQSALPLNIPEIKFPHEDERSFPYHLRMEPPFDKEPLFPHSDGGVIEYEEVEIGFCWNSLGNKEYFFLASPVFPFERIK